MFSLAPRPPSPPLSLPLLTSRLRSPPSFLPLSPLPSPSLHSLPFPRGNLTSLSPLLRLRLRLRLRSPFPYHPHATASIRTGSDSNFKAWDSITAKFAAAANVPFLLLQLPQIVLNARNLLAGDKAALFAVPWLGMLTGLLGNLSLLSYFAKKKETEAVVVQTLGVISTYAVIAQLAMAQSMPLPHFLVTSAVVGAGLVLNFLNYFGWLSDEMWRLWEDFITVGGLSVLPQVMWSTFVPFVPNSILPGIVSCVCAVAAVIMARTGKLSEEGIKLVQSTSGWTATLLFMWMPVAQMWTNFLNPDNIKGLSAFTMLLAMLGNGLMIPRALFIRDLMWFTGSAWASFLHGWGNLFCMYWNDSMERYYSPCKQFARNIHQRFSFWVLICGGFISAICIDYG